MAEAAFIVRDDEIHVRTKYEHRQRCKSVPFAEWDARKKVWRFPATPESATLLRNSFSGVGRCKVDKGFQDLLKTFLTPQKVDNYYLPDIVLENDPREVDPALLPDPPDVKTPLWGHQKQAFWFIVKLFGGLPDAVVSERLRDVRG